MEIVIKAKKKAKLIKRDNRQGGGGIIRIDEESCVILEGIANKLTVDVNIKELASALIKAAADSFIIKEEVEDEE